MERSLEFFANGCVVIKENGQPIEVIETQGEVKALFRLLQFTTAKTFTLALPDQPLPEIEMAQRRGTPRINQTGLDLLKGYEGCELTAYQDQVGVWTIGYGHTKGVRSGMTITQTQADQWLQEDVEEYEAAVTECVQANINNNQFSALVSFSFNLGAFALFESTLLKLLNQGKILEAANEFPRWNKAGGAPALGLTRRRLSERALFLSQDWRPYRAFEMLRPSNPPIQGEFVRFVQTTLKNAGFNLSVNGKYDQDTEKAVMQFQQQKQLDADGVVGVETCKAF
jgi:GH24 family phage-related lysozyme (muramidase)